MTEPVCPVCLKPLVDPGVNTVSGLVVHSECTSSRLPEVIEWVDAELVDDVPRKPVCWWRLGPCIRWPDKTAADWGVEVRFRKEGVILLQAGYERIAACEDWLMVFTPDNKRVVSIDLLCFKPPPLPEPCDWQRMTYWNDKTHPGDNMDNWRFDFDGPEAWE